MANYAMYKPNGDWVSNVVWDGEAPFDVSPNTLVLIEGEDPAATPSGPIVIAPVSPLQMRRALRAAGLLDAINAFVATDDDKKDAWEYATYYDRNDPLILEGAKALDMTDEQIDGLFLAASQM